MSSSRIRKWVKGIASIGDFIEAAGLSILITAAVIAGVMVLGDYFLG